MYLNFSKVKRTLQCLKWVGKKERERVGRGWVEAWEKEESSFSARLGERKRCSSTKDLMKNYWLLLTSLFFERRKNSRVGILCWSNTQIFMLYGSCFHLRIKKRKNTAYEKTIKPKCVYPYAKRNREFSYSIQYVPCFLQFLLCINPASGATLVLYCLIIHLI